MIEKTIECLYKKKISRDRAIFMEGFLVASFLAVCFSTILLRWLALPIMLIIAFFFIVFEGYASISKIHRDSDNRPYYYAKHGKRVYFDNEKNV